MPIDQKQTSDRSSLLVCLDCGVGVHAGNKCGAHPEEPLFDPNDPDVQDEMERIDSTRKHKVLAFWSALGGFVGFAYALPLGAIFADRSELELRAAIFIIALLASPAILLGNLIGRRRYRPMFEEWIHEEFHVADPEDVEAVNSGKGTPPWPDLFQ